MTHAPSAPRADGAPAEPEVPGPGAPFRAGDADAALQPLLEGVSGGFAVLDRALRFRAANAQFTSLLAPLKRVAGGLAGHDLGDAFPDLRGTPFDGACRRALATTSRVDVAWFHPTLGRWLDVRVTACSDAVTISLLDVTAHKDAEDLLACEKKVLEQVVGGAGLGDVLATLACEVEALSSDGLLCSVLRLDRDGERLLHGAAPHLPEAYNRAIHGLRIGPGVGSCGTAAHERVPVDAVDIASDPRWTAFRDLALGHGLAACCSTPVFASNGSVLGTIAMYYRTPTTPSARDRTLIATATRLASIALERDLAEAALREGEAELRALADSIPQLAWMARPDGDIFWYNRQWYAFTGTTPQAMAGWGWTAVHDPDVLPEVLRRWRESVATGTPFEMEFPLRGADGAFRTFLTRVNPLRDAEGRVVRWFGTNTDVEQVKRVRDALREETRTLEVLNRTGASLASNLDLEALVQQVTDAATELSGARHGAFFYNTTGADGDAFTLYALSGAPRASFAYLGQPRTTPLFAPTFRGEGVVRCDDVLAEPRYGTMAPHRGMPPGHPPVRSYLAVPVIARSGEVIGGLFFGHPEPGVFTARSERIVAAIAAQAAIAIDNARLYQAAQRAAEERSGLLASERHARSEAERTSRMKDEFLATLSHELRTPLSAILGWASVLRSGRAGEADLRHGLEAIERNARAQTQLIEDLLDMSRIVSGKLRLDVQEVHPASFVESALQTVRPAAAAKALALDATIAPDLDAITGDPGRLQQVVWNLLANAIKFTPHGGSVRLTLARAPAHVEIAVADTGAGIDPAFLPHVFDRFRQADASMTRRFGGMGLGLSIVRHLVELHGGTVHAESAGEGLGATFTVRLPLAVARSGELAAPSARPAGARVRDLGCVELRGLRVLVVDDQPDARELAARVLAECGAEVVTAASASEALPLVERMRPAVLVSDIGMPDVDGYELLRRVRALGPARGGAVPAIALTAFARDEDRAHALRAGFVLHLGKPVEPAELVAAVASVDESSRR